MPDDTRKGIRQRAFGSMLRNAVLSWESAVTAIVAVILFLFVQEPFPWWQAWFWLVGGALAELALVGATLTDPGAAQEAVSRELESRFDIREIQNAVSRERLQNALEYRRNMLELLKRHKGAMRTSLQHTVSDIDNWITHMHNLARHIDAFEGNTLVERDRRRMPEQLEKARIRLAREDDSAVRNDLENQIQALEKQQQNLDATINSIKRAEIQLESTLTALATVYAQMSHLGTKEVDSSRAQRLRLEIQDEVTSLQDTIDAMDEVQAQSLRLR